VKKLENKPFALIGVNGIGHEPESLKKVMQEENLPWRSFADKGSIFRKWGLSGTPTFYLIDHEGVIRHKWVGPPGQHLDAAIDALIGAAEDAARKQDR